MTQTTFQATPKPLTQADAARILDAAIRRKMEADKVSYAVALSKLQQEKPALIEGYQAVTRRTIKPRYQKKEITK